MRPLERLPAEGEEPGPSCRCAVHPGYPCQAGITAEDLLCDICRDAAGKCSRISYNGTWMPCHAGPLEFQCNVRLLLPC